MADFTYDPGLVINDTTGLPVPNATGEFRATRDGAPVPVYDLNGVPMAGLSTSPVGVCQRFSADISTGYMFFAGPVQFVASDQQQNALPAATAAQTAAQTAATQATAAASSATAAASAAQSTSTAALTAATWERVPQNPAGTWTPQQSVVPRVFVRTIVGSDRPSNTTIVGSTLRAGDRVEHEVDLP